jgi:hypothetical protein
VTRSATKQANTYLRISNMSQFSIVRVDDFHLALFACFPSHRFRELILHGHLVPRFCRHGFGWYSMEKKEKPASKLHKRVLILFGSLQLPHWMHLHL